MNFEGSQLCRGWRDPGLSIQSGARADNCLIACNSNLAATVNLHLPGGVFIDNGVLVNCTVVDNYGRATGGVWIDNMFGGGVVGSVTNCVMAGNHCVAAANDANFLAAKTDGGATGFIAMTAKPVACATDTVKLGDDSVVGTMQGFFRLKRSRPYSLRDKSPLCDAGVDVNLPTDLLGNSRPFNRRYDIGCYESQVGGFVLMVR